MTSLTPILPDNRLQMTMTRLAGPMRTMMVNRSRKTLQVPRNLLPHVNLLPVLAALSQPCAPIGAGRLRSWPPCGGRWPSYGRRVSKLLWCRKTLVWKPSAWRSCLPRSAWSTGLIGLCERISSRLPRWFSTCRPSRTKPPGMPAHLVTSCGRSFQQTSNVSTKPASPAVSTSPAKISTSIWSDSGSFPIAAKVMAERLDGWSGSVYVRLLGGAMCSRNGAPHEVIQGLFLTLNDDTAIFKSEAVATHRPNFGER